MTWSTITSRYEQKDLNRRAQRQQRNFEWNPLRPWHPSVQIKSGSCFGPVLRGVSESVFSRQAERVLPFFDTPRRSRQSRRTLRVRWCDTRKAEHILPERNGVRRSQSSRTLCMAGTSLATGFGESVDVWPLVGSRPRKRCRLQRGVSIFLSLFFCLHSSLARIRTHGRQKNRDRKMKRRKWVRFCTPILKMLERLNANHDPWFFNGVDHSPPALHGTALQTRGVCER